MSIQKRWAKPLNTEGPRLRGWTFQYCFFWKPSWSSLTWSIPAISSQSTRSSFFHLPRLSSHISPSDSLVCVCLTRLIVNTERAGAGSLCVWRCCSFLPWPPGAGPDRRQTPEQMDNHKLHGVGNKLQQTAPSHSRSVTTKVSAGLITNSAPL